MVSVGKPATVRVTGITAGVVLAVPTGVMLIWPLYVPAASEGVMLGSTLIDTALVVGSVPPVGVKSSQFPPSCVLAVTVNEPPPVSDSVCAAGRELPV